MFKRLAEKLLGLDKGYFDQPGEIGHRWFDPHWPGPLLGSAGSLRNYVLAIVVLGLLVLLFRRGKNPRLQNLRKWLAAGAGIVVPLILLAAVGPHFWSILLLLAMLAIVGHQLYHKDNAGLLITGRIALFGFFLMLLSGTLAWNLALATAAGLLIVWVYRHEGRATHARIILGVLRGALAAFVLLLLNNPILTRTTTITQPSVLPVLIDHTLSMSVKDVPGSAAGSEPTRLQAATDLLTGEDQALLKRLGKVHSLRFYSFDSNARPIGTYTEPPEEKDKDKQKDQKPPEDPNRPLMDSLKALKADGSSTQVISSLLTVLDELQGQRLAGIVVVTDGRDTPTQPPAEVYHTLANYGVKVFPITVGSDNAPKNIELQSISVQDSAFKGDVVNVRFTVRAGGFESGHAVKVKLIDNKTNQALRDQDGKPAEITIHAADDKPIEEELLFRPDKVGPLDVRVEADKEPGEIDEQDNVRVAQMSVLDASINVLYVEGYPRWEYRYIKNEMIRDNTVNISCLLTSADPTFAQEGDDPLPADGPDMGSKFPGRITRFPESLELLMLYDVVLFGDVDPRQFTDAQLQMVSDFVAKKGGGFGMVAGPRWSPAAFRNTPIDLLLPVNTSRMQAEPANELIVDGFRPVLTKSGSYSSIYRFFADRHENERYIREQLQPLFWYCRGITAKPGVGDVFSEHPTDFGPDGRKSPILVLGRFGAGRTLFSAVDDSWRWRYYTGEGVFDTYWVQQLRYLARSKKLGQRKLTFSSDRQTYQQGEQVRLGLRVLDSILLQQLPPEIGVQVVDADGQTVRSDKLQKDNGQSDYYTATFAADRLGRFTVKLPPVIPDPSVLDLPIEVIVPRLELTEPQVNRTAVTRIAAETGGTALSLDEARAKLPDLITSAARTVALMFSQPLWDKPAAMIIFVLLITMEWVMRKVYGMV
jgi:uncharacterized membrane protein